MHVVGHDDESMNDQPFVLLAMFERLGEYFLVFPSGEQVNPVNDREGNEVQTFRVGDFKCAAQSGFLGKIMLL